MMTRYTEKSAASGRVGGWQSVRFAPSCVGFVFGQPAVFTARSHSCGASTRRASAIKIRSSRRTALRHPRLRRRDGARQGRSHAVALQAVPQSADACVHGSVRRPVSALPRHCKVHQTGCVCTSTVLQLSAGTLSHSFQQNQLPKQILCACAQGRQHCTGAGSLLHVRYLRELSRPFTQRTRWATQIVALRRMRQAGINSAARATSRIAWLCPRRPASSRGVPTTCGLMPTHRTPAAWTAGALNSSTTQPMWRVQSAQRRRCSSITLQRPCHTPTRACGTTARNRCATTRAHRDV